MPEAATLNEAFVKAAHILRRAGIETPELDARLLLCHVGGLSHETYIANAQEALQPEAAARLEQAIARRLRREPISRITGTREFYGRDFLLGPETLDPRSDTETLVEAALESARAGGGRKRKLSLLDLGTGTGCILITLLAELPHAHGLGTDVSESALALAATNAERLGVADRASFLAADWLDSLCGRFEFVLSNPPYIATADIAELAADVSAYDPRRALDGGPDGLEAYRRVAARIRNVLAEDGKLLVEIGARQSDEVAEIFATAGLEIAESRHDLAGRPRVVVVSK